jgi:hypothetical protein
MPTTVNISTSYAGEFAGRYIAAALLSAPTIDKGGVTVMPNVKYKSVVKKVSTDANLVKDASCEFQPTGTVTLTERVVQPKELQVNLNLCKSTFSSDWSALEMGFSAFDVIPKSFSDFLIAHVSEKVAAATEASIWTGVGGTSGQFAGFGSIVSTDPLLPAAQEVAGTSAISAAATVITELGKIVDAIPATVYGKEDLKIYVPSGVARAYVRALGGFSVAATSNSGTEAKGTQWYTNGELSFDGIPLFVVNGLAANTAICAQSSNLYFATGLMSDMSEVQVIDTSATLGDKNCRVIMRYTAGVQIGAIEDVVTYGIPNAAN